MKRPAFHFYPGDWRGSRWVSLDAGFPMMFPAKPACYVIYLDGVLSYIGQTNDLRKRMAGHGIDICRYSEGFDTPWGQYDDVVIKARFGSRFGDWAMREARLIARLQPPLNCVGSTRKRGTAS